MTLFSAVTYTNLGSLYYVEGKIDKARDNFSRSLMVDPLMLEPRRGLVRILIDHAEYQKAIDLCLKNLDIVEDDKATLILLISIFIRDKDFTNLKKYTYRIINLETSPDALTYLGVFMSQHNAPLLASDCFKKAMQVSPYYMDAYRQSGRLLTSLGKYDEAVRIWKIGLSLNPSDHILRNYILKDMELKSKESK